MDLLPLRKAMHTYEAHTARRPPAPGPACGPGAANAHMKPLCPQLFQRPGNSPPLMAEKVSWAPRKLGGKAHV